MAIIVPAPITSANYTTIVKQGSFDSDIESQINALSQANDILVASSQNAALGFASIGTAITLLSATNALNVAGTFIFTCYGVVTTTLAGGSVSGFAFVLGFTDDSQAQTPTAATVSAVSAGTAVQGAYAFRSKGGVAITFNPNYLTGAPTSGVIAYSATLQRIL